MRLYIRFIAAMLILMIAGYVAWLFAQPHLAEMKLALIEFKRFCRAQPFSSYALYAGVLTTTLFLSLPLTTLVMLLAGVTYSFWEAATLITFCRLGVAVAAFMLARHLLQTAPRQKRKPYLLRKFERHPAIGLFLARMAFIPDSVVSYTVAASKIRSSDYVLISLLGMIPFTLACVWLGNELGTVSRLIQFLR